MTRVFLCRKLNQAEGLNEGLRHKKRVAKQIGFLCKAPKTSIRNEMEDIRAFNTIKEHNMYQNTCL
jgi:hypothetical protein